MWIVADVEFDSDAEAREAERLAREGKLAGISIDYSSLRSEIEIRETDDEGFPTDWLETTSEAEILGATQLAMPAFADARIEFGENGPVAFLAPEGVETSDRRIFEPGAFRWRDPAPLMFLDKTTAGHDEAVFVGNLTNFRRSLVAFAAGADPNLGMLTKPRIADGKLTGHGAGWGTCHRGFKNACVTAPSCSYELVADGVPIYSHPGGDIHAPLGLDSEDTAQWYEAHCDKIGLAAVGEDSHGIWVDGETSLEDGEVFLSGDWRDVDGELELVSFLVVESPGFPTAMVAAEHQTALVAAGIVTEVDRVAALEARVNELELMRQADQILASLGDSDILT